jgi:hypothetical protein
MIYLKSFAALNYSSQRTLKLVTILVIGLKAFYVCKYSCTSDFRQELFLVVTDLNSENLHLHTIIAKEMGIDNYVVIAAAVLPKNILM